MAPRADSAIVAEAVTTMPAHKDAADGLKMMKTELLNERLFLGLDHARTKITNWVDDYNQRRPHSALGYPRGSAPGICCLDFSGSECRTAKRARTDWL
jgi:transposase InsO family protein